MNRPINAALAYAARGWAVFPCHNPIAGGCSCWREDCGSPAKHPRVAGGLKVATNDRWQIQAWWRRWPNANVAVRTGAISGLVVVDVDPPHGGDESMAKLLAEHGPIPSGRVVRTGSGGAHYYFAHPGGTIQNDAGRKLGPGLDIRGDGGYVIAPPSQHISGARYQWTWREACVPQAPEWLVEQIRPPVRRLDSTSTQVRHGDRWAKAALARELEAVAAATEGTRNVTLNRAAFNLGQLVGAGKLDEHHVAASLLAGAGAAGLAEREALPTLLRVQGRHRSTSPDPHSCALPRSIWSVVR